mgnify:CR=1 FL=1
MDGRANGGNGFHSLNKIQGKRPESQPDAGPVARFLEIAAKENGIEPDLGTPEDEIYTLEMFRAMQGVSDNDDEQPSQPSVEAPAAPAEAPMAEGGLMAMAAAGDEPAGPDTQASMLGYDAEDDNELG